MFAVIKTGGKQYKVAANDRFTVEKLAAEAGQTVQFNDVLMLGGDGDIKVGAPFVAGAAVQAEVVEQTRGPKVVTFKKRRRKHGSARKRGHRQQLTLVQVTEILASGAEKSGVMAAVGAGSAPTVTPAPAAKPSKAEKPVKAARPAKAEKPKVAAAPARSEAEQLRGVRPSNLLDAPKGEADDLRKISGVGPKLLGLLNENGVHHFWQIAEWGPEEIAYMDDKLSFKGRIERDGWIEQAKKFAAEAGEGE